MEYGNDRKVEDQQQPLLEVPSAEDKKYPSFSRQIAVVFSILSLQFFCLCADTVIFPFFPPLAKEKGLNNTYIGIIFAAFDISKSVFSPVFGSLVSILEFYFRKMKL